MKKLITQIRENRLHRFAMGVTIGVIMEYKLV